jgi:hypothetical protein
MTFDDSVAQAKTDAEAYYHSSDEIGIKQGHRIGEVVEDTTLTTNSEPRIDASCDASAENSDSYSDASTDVGDDDDIEDLCEEEVGVACVIESARVAQNEETASRPPLFGKVSRQQRVEQVRRIVEEFCTLDFDLVDASCQEALVLRMLTILKALSEKTTFVGEHGCSEAKRYVLLGLSQDDENAIKGTIFHAEKLWSTRSFHSAFNALAKAVPILRGMPKRLPEGMGQEEIESMKLRRLEKRQRQRQERREQRTTERATRSAQRYNRGFGQSSSSATSSRSKPAVENRWGWYQD